MVDVRKSEDETLKPIDISDLDEQIRHDIHKRMKQLVGHRPTIAIFGKTGAGKSSLGNALFGREVFAVSSVRAGTRTPNLLSAVIFGVDMTLIDFPGVGESRDRDEEYRALYREWIPRIDVALWVVKMDDRVLAPDLDYFEQVLKPEGFSLEQLVIVISQADKADPVREWDVAQAKPSAKQAHNIAEKITQLSEAFGIAPSQVIPVAAEDRYNLHSLAEQIVLACPNEAALNVARALEGELRTEKIRKTVLGKIWAAIGRFYNDNEDKIHRIVVNIVLPLLVRERK